MCLLFFPIQVSTDGYVSLDDALTSFEFTPFPLPAPNTSPVIAPLWIRTSSVLTIYSSTIDYRIASDAETLQLSTGWFSANCICYCDMVFQYIY